MSDQFGSWSSQHGGQYINKYSEAQNREFTAVFSEITEGFKKAMLNGLSPDDPVVQELVLRHYQFCLQFWKPDRDSYRSLAMSYILPSPYRDAYEEVATGLGQYHYEAIVVFAERNL